MSASASKDFRALVVVLASLALHAQTAQTVQQRVSALEQQAQKALHEQKPDQAIPPLRELVTLDPKNVASQGNLGVLLYFQNAFAEAVPHLRAALELQPGLARIQALLGLAEKRTGDPKAALADLERAFPSIDDKKIKTQAGLELIELYSAAADLQKALSLARVMEEADPQNPQIHFVNYRIARQLMDQSIVGMMSSAPDSAEVHMVMGGELGRQGDAANAIAQYREAIKLNPMLPGVHFELAEQLRLSTDPALSAQAEDEYRAALKVNEFDESSWRQLGGIQAAKGDFKAAEESYRKALRLWPADALAKTGLANVLASVDRPTEAVSLLESALRDDPANVAAHYRLSLLYRRAGRTADAQRETAAFNHYKELRESFDKVFRLLGGSVRETPSPPPR